MICTTYAAVPARYAAVPARRIPQALHHTARTDGQTTAGRRPFVQGRMGRSAPRQPATLPNKIASLQEAIARGGRGAVVAPPTGRIVATKV